MLFQNSTSTLQEITGCLRTGRPAGGRACAEAGVCLRSPPSGVGPVPVPVSVSVSGGGAAGTQTHGGRGREAR